MTQADLFEHDHSTKCHAQALSHVSRGYPHHRMGHEWHFVDVKGSQFVEIHAPGIPVGLTDLLSFLPLSRSEFH